MLRKSIFTICLFCVSAQALASSDDKFIKKYAMMKIYESCFGPEVVKQIREEMKDAYAKCSLPPSFEESPNPPQMSSVLLGKLPPGFSMDPSTQTITKPTDGASLNQDNDLPNMDAKPQKQTPMAGVLSFRPLTPNFPQQAIPQAGIPPYMMQNPQFRPFSPAAPFFQTPYSAPGMFYPPGLPYNPYAYPQQFQQAFYQQPFFGAGRMALGTRQMKSYESPRDLDIRDRLELISRGPSAGRLRNVTCVMQELGYIDHNLEPNYEQITQRINNLPVPTALKTDIQDGLQFCQKFSQCVPEIKRDVAPLSQELIKPMFFFRCYKHKKLEACIMKDIRERFTSEDELDSESDFRFISRSARSVRDDSLPDPRFEALDEMAAYFYDYLSGSTGMDYDLYL
ncbi:uncharacterized protein LOC106707832 isoform X1 [Papilio machaon]|uniref:uncharacterized protein LOC106707832 isoform X1 n=1 Tax=Papilio machaon TaxID=76193 RepID=UPI001E663D8D|nr:uncharacterized protein LOC106707832 isoform X1 [Papilio machaon]